MGGQRPGRTAATSREGPSPELSACMFPGARRLHGIPYDHRACIAKCAEDALRPLALVSPPDSGRLKYDVHIVLYTYNVREYAAPAERRPRPLRFSCAGKTVNSPPWFLCARSCLTLCTLPVRCEHGTSSFTRFVTVNAHKDSAQTLTSEGESQLSCIKNILI